MANIDKVTKGLECCINGNCKECPYFIKECCLNNYLQQDALTLLKYYKEKADRMMDNLKAVLSEHENDE